MIDAFQYEFMRNALAAGLLTSVICGVVGTLVVVNRIVFLSGGIAHAAYGGIGIAFFFGLPYLAGTLGFTLAAALGMAAVTLKAKHRSDTIIGVLWAVGMALGVVLMDLAPGYKPDMMSYLFGSILTVPTGELWMMSAVAIVNIGVAGFYYNEYLAMSYDEQFAQIRRVPVKRLYFLFIGLLAISIVMVIQVVGLILVIALLTIPPFIAEKYVHSMARMMVLSSILSIIFTVAGLYLAFRFNLTSGAAIILVAGAGFLISLLLERPLASRRSPDPPTRPAKAGNK